jgi:hypothetical protein
MVEDWNSTFTTVLSRYPAMDERIYLVFGDDPVPGADGRTSYDGRYRFGYLRTGKYRVYAYSDRFATSGNTSNQEPVWIDFELESRRDTKNIGHPLDQEIKRPIRLESKR